MMNTTKMKIVMALGGVGIMLGTAASALGGEMRMAPPALGIPAVKPVCDTFDTSSTGLDVFAVGVFPSDDMFDESAGGGVGATRYVNSYLGFSSSYYLWYDGESAVHSLTGNVLLRYPIRSLCIAPYVTAGVGGHFNSVNQFTSQIGAGVEFAFPTSCDLLFFVEGTYVFADTTDDYTSVRVGTRVNF